ncbi:MAG: hypothetical protein M1546_11750 [Chloroflexi bacterium]|nr:hypothetical protein [Chloroflexota bacterium]
MSTEDVGSNVKLDLYRGESFSQTISTSTDNDGYYGWLIPTMQEPGTDYKIKITAASNPSINDYSDGYFTITQTSLSSLRGLLALESVDAYAETDDHSELDVGDEEGESLTVEVWFYDLGQLRRGIIVNKEGAYELLAERYASGSQIYGCIGFHLESPSGQSGGFTRCEWPAYLSGWHHVAGVFDKDTGIMRIYMDGEAFGEQYFGLSINNSSGLLRVGRGKVTLGLGGMVDEVRISSVARSPGITYPVTPFTCDAHTRALWHFDEPEGATVFHDACGVDNMLIDYNGAHAEGVTVYRVYLPLVAR